MTMPRDNVKMTVSGTPGLGTITLLSAVTGFQTVDNAGTATGETVSYFVVDGGNWEYGRGVYTTAGTTLTRSPIASTNGGGLINLSSGAVVWLTALAEDLNFLPYLLVQAVSQIIPANCGVYVPDDYEIGSGLTVDLEISSTGAFEIG